MRIKLTRGQLAWACLGGAMTAICIIPRVAAQVLPVMQGELRPSRSTPRIEYHAPMTPEEAATWKKLSQPIPMKIGREIRLSEFLNKIKMALIDGDRSNDIQFYVEPLQISEPGPEPTIAMNLDRVKAGTALELGLKQQDLRFYVNTDGIVMITSSFSTGELEDRRREILDQLKALQTELRELRAMIEAGK